MDAPPDSPVPVTVFTGFFGVGKTTAIQALLAGKPAGESWAVLVNEFGEVGVDGAVLAGGDGVEIREIPGGCLCCVANVPMKAAVAEILGRVRPHRLIIEPTGLGHPAGVVDELRDGALAAEVAVRAVICLVDPRHALDPRIQDSALFADQVHLADVLVANKADLASAAELQAFQDWAVQLFPAKTLILSSVRGAIAPALLDLPGEMRAPLFPGLHDHHHHGHHDHHDHQHDNVHAGDPGHHHDGPVQVSGDPAPGQPLRFENRAEGHVACGWVFDSGDVFRRDALLDLLGPPGPPGVPEVVRLKGVFRTGADWLLVDRAGGETTVRPVAYRRDSRLEVIAGDEAVPDWRALETALLGLQERTDSA